MLGLWVPSLLTAANTLKCQGSGSSVIFNSMFGLAPAESTITPLFSTNIFPNAPEGMTDYYLNIYGRLSCYIGVSKKVYCSDQNGHGGSYLGDGDTTVVSNESAVSVSGFDGLTPDTSAQYIVRGMGNCAVTMSNKQRCWGNNGSFTTGGAVSALIGL